MANAPHSARLRVVSAALLALLLGACGTSNTATPAAPSAAASSAAAVGTPVGVVETEFSITLDKTSFTPSTYTFTIKNQGKFPHNLNIEGPGVDKKTSPKLGAGESGVLTVNLQKGSYELWCSVDSHKAKGMDKTITVG